MKKLFIMMIVGIFISVPNDFESAYAQGINLGRIKVFPEISYRGTYEDNVFMENRNSKNDFVHRITPSIRAEYGDVNAQSDSTVGKIAISGTRFAAGYSTEFVFYNDFNDNNFLGHSPFVSFLYRSPMGFYVKTDESFRYSEDVYGSLNQYNIGIKTKRWDNSFGVSAGYQSRIKLGADITYVNTLARYDENIDKWQNRTDHQISTSISYKATPKTTFFTQYRHTIGDYNNQNDGILGWSSRTSQDYTKDDYFLGIGFDPTAKIRGEIKLGYGKKNFENEYDRFGRKYEDSSSWIAETSVSYRPREKTGINFKLLRSHEGSPDADSSSYLSTVVGASVSQEIGRRINAMVGFDWERLDFSNENFESPKKYFDLYSATASIDYRILRWLTAGLSYSYQSKIANNPFYESDEYDVNRISVYSTAKF